MHNGLLFCIKYHMDYIKDELSYYFYRRGCCFHFNYYEHIFNYADRYGKRYEHLRHYKKPATADSQ